MRNDCAILNDLRGFVLFGPNPPGPYIQEPSATAALCETTRWCKSVAAANLAEAILGGAPGVNILATSREPLRAAAERVYHLGPLDIPPPSPRVTAAEAAAFPAVNSATCAALVCARIVVGIA